MIGIRWDRWRFWAIVNGCPPWSQTPFGADDLPNLWCWEFQNCCCRLFFLTNRLLIFVLVQTGYSGTALLLNGRCSQRPKMTSALRRWLQSGRINITSARSFNRGLRVDFISRWLGWRGSSADPPDYCAIVTVIYHLAPRITHCPRTHLLENEDG